MPIFSEKAIIFLHKQVKKKDLVVVWLLNDDVLKDSRKDPCLLEGFIPAPIFAIKFTAQLCLRTSLVHNGNFAERLLTWQKRSV